MEFDIVVDGYKCIGCGKCVENCPKQVFGFFGPSKNPSTRRYRPEKCIGCMTCVKNCPVSAIMVQKN